MPAQPPDADEVGPQAEAVMWAADHGLGGSELQVLAVESGDESGGKGKGRGLGAWLAIGWIAFVLIIGVLAHLELLPLDSPTNDIDALCARRGPFADEGKAAGHLLGCDTNGRDLASRLAYGGGLSMLIAVGAVALGLAVGGTLGMVAGFFGGRVDTVITSILNVMLSIPAVILALALTAFLQKPPEEAGGGSAIPVEMTLVLAIGIVSIPLLGRITRASALTWSQREFVLAARAQGAKNLRIMVREVLPNVLPAMASIALLGVAVAIVAEGTLSILGVGVKPPTPTWGTIIGLDRGALSSSPHIVFLPSILIFVTVLALNFLGDVVRARFDVREAGI